MLALLPTATAWSQFLRLGPFDFEARSRAEGIYTTNVEQERESEASLPREDLYFIWGVDLTGNAEMGPRTRLNVDTGIALEKHVNRPDLDNSEAPFGRFGGRFDTDFSPITIYGDALYERTSEPSESVYAPGFPSSFRQVGTTLTYGYGIDWVTKYIQFGASYTMTQERYDDLQFIDAENDEQTINYYLTLTPHRYVTFDYTMDRTKTDFVNMPGGEGEWEGEEEITINIDISEALGLFERPRIEYSIGVQNEYDEYGESEGWDIIHGVTISDTYEPGPSLRWGFFITYEYQQKLDQFEDDEVTLEFGGQISHQLSTRISHNFSATRQPIDTLGSTAETTETTFTYGINVTDFPFRNVGFNASADYTRSEPPVGEIEETLTYTVGIAHSVALSRRLSRSIRYDYTRESSNLEVEILDEHRFTLSYQYQF